MNHARMTWKSQKLILYFIGHMYNFIAGALHIYVDKLFKKKNLFVDYMTFYN